MAITVKKAGKRSEKSFTLIFTISIIRYIPTTMRTGAVAADVTIDAIGEKKVASKKQIAVTNAVKPVFPPAAIPDADSAYTVTVEVPKSEPTTVESASAVTTRLKLFLPSSPSSIPASVSYTHLTLPTKA